MKKIIPALLLSNSLWACPNLTGNFTVCHNLTNDNTTNVDIKITQARVRRTTVYTFTSTDPETKEVTVVSYRANGKTSTQTEQDPQTGDSITLRSTAYCSRDSLEADMEILYNNEYISKLHTTLKTEDGKLFQTVTYSDEGMERTEETICE